MSATESPQHVLIAGCGYVGHRAALAWIARGTRVTALTRSADKAQSLLDDGIKPLVADLATGSLPEIPAVDTVLWAVGFERSSLVDRRTIWIDGLRNLLQSLPQTVRRFLYVSSTSVYGENDGEVVTEQTTPAPSSEGGQCCLDAEQIVRQSDRSEDSSIDTVVLRMAGIYGPNRLLRRIDELRQKKELPGEPDHPLNLIHIDDAVTAILDSAAHRNPPPLLNVVNTGTLTRREYYSELARRTNSPSPQFAQSRVIGAGRGSNKRVVSSTRELLNPSFRFDDVRRGIQDAVDRTAG